MNCCRTLTLLLLLCFQLSLKSQDTAYVRKIINTLASPVMYGRGYVNDGDKKAAEFIESKLKEIGIAPFNDSYLQEVKFSLNTYPGAMQMILDNDTLSPVDDFVISPFSNGIKGKFPLVYLPQEADTIKSLYDSLMQVDYTGKVIVTNFPSYNIFAGNPFNASAVIDTWSKSFWWLYTNAPLVDIPVFVVVDSLIVGRKEIEINVESKYLENHIANNVVGFVLGTEYPDSFVVFSAHYDHLGAMGEGNIFRGANDNASGVAMVLNLAQYFKKNPAKYSTAFIFFAGEEVNLYGARKYVEEPLFPLSQISSLINLDMVGSGSDGIGIVNGYSNPDIVNSIKDLCIEHHYFDSLNIRGASCNSDHCPFHEAGVPAIFIYTQGKECVEYHNLNDIPEKTLLTKYNELFRLLVGYVVERN